MKKYCGERYLRKLIENLKFETIYYSCYQISMALKKGKKYILSYWTIPCNIIDFPHE